MTKATVAQSRPLTKTQIDALMERLEKEAGAKMRALTERTKVQEIAARKVKADAANRLIRTQVMSLKALSVEQRKHIVKAALVSSGSWYGNDAVKAWGIPDSCGIIGQKARDLEKMLADLRFNLVMATATGYESIVKAFEAKINALLK